MPDPDADLLGVRADAPLADLKQAYRKAALAHHPDQNPHPEAARHFRRLTEAYRSLEARAVRREPPRPKRIPSPEDRLSFLLGDLKSLLRRWQPDRWTAVVEGLPAAVWALSALQVVGEAWPGAPLPEVRPTAEGLAAWAEFWADLPLRHPLPRPLAPGVLRRLNQTLDAAEARLKALDLPAKKQRYSR